MRGPCLRSPWSEQTHVDHGSRPPEWPNGRHSGSEFQLWKSGAARSPELNALRLRVQSEKSWVDRDTDGPGEITVDVAVIARIEGLGIRTGREERGAI